MEYRWKWMVAYADHKVIREFDENGVETLFNKIPMDNITSISTTNGKDMLVLDLIKPCIYLTQDCTFKHFDIEKYLPAEDGGELTDITPVQLKQGYTDFHFHNMQTTSCIEYYMIGFKAKCGEIDVELMIKIDGKDEKTLHVKTFKEGNILQYKIETIG